MAVYKPGVLNGKETYVVPVIIDQKEQNEELYLKFVDSRSGQTIGNRVTTILWRGKNETQK